MSYWKKITNYIYFHEPLDLETQKRALNLKHLKMVNNKLVPNNLQKYKAVNHKHRLGFYKFISELRIHLKSHGFTEIKPKGVQSTFDCFGRLLEDKTHPSRSEIDTFYLPFDIEIDPQNIKASPIPLKDLAISNHNGKLTANAVLNTHTTARAFSYYSKNGTASEKYFIIGRVFRNQRQDKTHTIEFHQLEISCFSKNISLASLIEVYNLIFAFAGWSKSDIRFKQCFYSYTEPSLEAEVKINGTWIEICGGGLFKRALLDQIGVNKKINALGTGIGLERLYSLYAQMSDIRQLLVTY